MWVLIVVILAIAFLAAPVIGYSYKMITSKYCSTSLTVGTYINNMGTCVDGTSRSVQVYRGSTLLTTGDSYVAGESLTVKLSSTSGEYCFEASNAVFSGSDVGCSGRRTNIDGQTLTMPTDGSTVSVWAGWATSQTDVAITSTFVLNPPSTTATSLRSVRLESSARSPFKSNKPVS